MALYLREAGQADAPCLVFLHGLWLSSSMWQPQIERLSHDYHCLAPDLPEHGKSTDIGLLTLENTSRVIANLIREHTPHGCAHVVGLSLGGSVALGLLRDVPEVVDHLLVSGTAARFSPAIAALSKLGKPLLRMLKPAPLISLVLRQSDIPQPYLSILREDVGHLKPEALPARAVMAPGVGHIWNLEAPDLFTETVRAWMTDQPLPRQLVVYG